MAKPGLKVRLLNPYTKTNNKLNQAVNGDKKIIRQKALAASQFSDNLADAHGKFHKPKDW